MKNPKIVNAMNYIDDETVEAANRQTTVLKTPTWKKAVAIAAAFALVFCGVLAAFKMAGVPVAAVDAVVALDVNPSIELEIDKDEKVISAKALNADAERVLSGMNLEGLDLNVVVNAIIGSMLQNGYLTVERNSILVSVNSENADRAAELQSEISGSIAKILDARHIEASVLSQRYEKNEIIEEIADEYDISIAKATMITKIVEAKVTDSHGNVYTVDSLAAINVHELKLILESKHVEIDGIQAGGQAASDTYIGKDKALAIALTHAGIEQGAIHEMEVEMDLERGIMVYSVEFETVDREYEYEIDAKTGEIVVHEEEPRD